MKIDRWKGSPDQDTTLTQALIDQEAKRVLRTPVRTRCGDGVGA